MKQLILSILILGLNQQSFAQVAGADKNNCHSIYANGQLTLKIDIALNDTKSIPDFFKLLQEDQSFIDAFVFSGVNSIRYESKNKSVIATYSNGNLSFELTQIDFLSQNFLGGESCHFAGESAVTLFELFKNSNHREYARTEVKGQSNNIIFLEGSLLSGHLKCTNSQYGHKDETPTCFFRP